MSQDNQEPIEDEQVEAVEDVAEEVIVEEEPQEEPEPEVDDELIDEATELIRRGVSTVEDVDKIRAAAFRTPDHWKKMEHFILDVLSENEADYDQKLAVGLAILGKYEDAEPKLLKLKKIPVAACLLGRIYLETGREKDSVTIFKEIHERVPEVKVYHVYLIEALEAAEDMDAFHRELELYEKNHPDDAYTFYFRGLHLEREGEYEEAMDLHEEALDHDPKMGRAFFRLAYRSDLEGRDEEAIDLYRQCIETGVSNLAALVNMGLLYDDAERYDEAIGCFRLVNRIYPTNERGQSYLRDAEASTTMYYDEEKEKKEDKQAQILRIPVTDFELSVRSRNCLSKMNIRTLGDLIKKTEAELLAFKNFGETSLHEIKGILSSKGLRLGMITSDSDEVPAFLEPTESDVSAQESMLNKPLDELDLSVRSRNCLSFLNIATLGQLADTTESQLVSCKNFGQTSLNEIRKKLADFGLALKS